MFLRKLLGPTRDPKQASVGLPPGELMRKPSLYWHPGGVCERTFIRKCLRAWVELKPWSRMRAVKGAAPVFLMRTAEASKQLPSTGVVRAGTCFSPVTKMRSRHDLAALSSNASLSVISIRSASLVSTATRGQDAQASALKSPAVLSQAEGCFLIRSLFASLFSIATHGRDAQALTSRAAQGTTASLILAATLKGMRKRPEGHAPRATMSLTSIGALERKCASL